MFQTCNVNTKDDILKNVGNSTVDSSHSLLPWKLMGAINCLVMDIL